ncbi:hypothetical protein VCV18_010503 [Metarhizium anisopliae]
MNKSKAWEVTARPGTAGSQVPAGPLLLIICTSREWLLPYELAEAALKARSVGSFLPCGALVAGDPQPVHP